MKYNVQQIHDAAEGASFYVQPNGTWLRMMWTEDTEFCALDEDSGEEYMFSFNEMVDEGENPEFHHLVRTAI